MAFRETIPGTRDMGHRLGTAQLKFLEMAMERGLSREQAGAAFACLRKHRLIKVDLTNQTYNVVHGNVWNPDVLMRAATECPKRGR